MPINKPIPARQINLALVEHLQKKFMPARSRNTSNKAAFWRSNPATLFMKSKTLLVFITSLAALVIAVSTNLFSNVLMLLMERANHIPYESNIFTFNPYVTNEGSSSYWIYGEDKSNYYHFTYKPNEPYWFIPKNNACKDFDKRDFSTWCSAQVGVAKGEDQ
ncbi:hypothetical protein WG219_20760 [Ectopseudomonas mendocina]|uniref:Uncharacterized protein n=1 Tax=Ectopseudomonas mendocina TaxID=300 RepID=A0ABZ2RFE9_ECTME